MPLQDILVGDLLGAIKEHRVEPLMHHAAGQGIAYFNQVKSAEEVFKGLVQEVEQAVGCWNTAVSLSA